MNHPATILILITLIFFSLCPYSCSSSSVQYVIMIDAGSTGSRVHIHSYSWSDDSALPIIQPSVNTKIKPGLSSYNIHPAEASKPMEELLEAARKAVPEEYRSATPIHLQATAGLRSITAAQAQAVLTVVRQCLAESEFLFEPEWATIITGEAEGINGWLATNYLLGAFDPSSPSTAHGVVEMGGASMQITFSPAQPSPSSLSRLTRVSVSGVDYHLYTHSYLAYGLQEAQKLYQRLMMDEIEEKGNPCYPVGYRFTSTGKFDTCLLLMQKVVDKSSISCDYDSCSFNGIWQPAIDAEPFLAIENFFYTNKFFTQSGEEEKEEGEVTKGNKLISTLKEKGREYCDDPWEQILTDHKADIDAGKESQASLSYYCFAAAYEAAVLEHGFGFNEKSNIRPARTVRKKAIDWELGATLRIIMKQDKQQELVTWNTETTTQSETDTNTNTSVSSVQPSWLGGMCSSRFCALSPLLLFSLLFFLCYGCCRSRRFSSSNRTYSYSQLHMNDRSNNLFNKV